MRPRMFFRALRPPMILGASLPGMIFPAQRPAEGSNSYHYGSHATEITQIMLYYLITCFHTTMVLTQLLSKVKYPVKSFTVSIPLWFSRNQEGNMNRVAKIKFPYHYGSHATASITKILYRFLDDRIK